MNQIAKYLTPKVVEQGLGLPAESIDSFSFLVMQELAKGVKPEAIAKELEVDESELHKLADSVTGGPGGLEHEVWRGGVTLIRSISLANQQVMGNGWDALEAMAVHRLAVAMQDAGEKVSIRDALAISQAANRAIRRGAGEGAGKASLLRPPPGGGEGDMTLNIQGGNIGSIRLSLSTRVQEQLGQVKQIDVEAQPRRMLTIDEIRNVKSDRDS